MRRLPWLMQVSPVLKRNTGERFTKGDVLEAEIKVVPFEVVVMDNKARNPSSWLLDAGKGKDMASPLRLSKRNQSC